MIAFAPKGVLRTIFATLPPFVALVLQWALWPLIQPFAWFLFCPAVFFSSWIGGLPAGLWTTAISTILVWWFFVPHEHPLAKGEPRYGARWWRGLIAQGAGALRPGGAGAAYRDGPLRGSDVLRPAPSAGAVLRLPAGSRRGAGPVPRGLRTAGMVGGLRVPPPAAGVPGSGDQRPRGSESASSGRSCRRRWANWGFTTWKWQAPPSIYCSCATSTTWVSTCCGATVRSRSWWSSDWTAREYGPRPHPPGMPAVSVTLSICDWLGPR